VLFISTCIIAGCKKEDDDNQQNSDNWAGAVAGTYIGNATEYGYTDAATTIITRISNTMINLQMNFSSDNYCLDSITMNSATTFGISEFDGCASKKASGGGNFSGSSLNYTWTQVGGSATSITFSGTK
jgi:hypothetical protein